MQNDGSGVGCMEIEVVPEILVFTCPQCGYAQRSRAGRPDRSPTARNCLMCSLKCGLD